MRKSDLVEVFIRVVGLYVFVELIDQLHKPIGEPWVYLLKLLISVLLFFKASFISIFIHRNNPHNAILQGLLSPQTIYELCFTLGGYLLFANYFPEMLFYLYKLSNTIDGKEEFYFNSQVELNFWKVIVGVIMLLGAKYFSKMLIYR